MKTRALLTSFGRVFAAALLTAYLQLGKAPLDLGLDDAEALLNAGIGALILTAINYFRTGETRFGRGSRDVGMGGEDTLEPGGRVQTPEGDYEVGTVDDPPRDGTFRDWDGMQHEPGRIAEGERLGYGTPDVDYVEDEEGVKEL